MTKTFIESSTRAASPSPGKMRFVAFIPEKARELKSFQILETVYEELNKVPIEPGAESFDALGGGGVTRSFFRFAFDVIKSIFPCLTAR